jgi:SOS-response transcriptional repressor LexA
MYAYIVNHFLQGERPTVREIGQVLNISSGHCQYHLSWLQQQGYIHRSLVSSRSLQLPQVAGTPLIGTVTDGIPMTTLSVMEEGLLQGEVPYALRITDDALLDEHMCKGDVILIKLTVSQQKGALVVAVHQEEKEEHGLKEARLTRLFPDSGWEGDWQVVGVVSTIVRLSIRRAL